MTVEQTRALVEPYLRSHDANLLAPDVVFTDLSSGQRYEGREAVGGMLHYIYHVAFDAHPEGLVVVVGEGRAFAEATFVGRHTGPFAGFAPTGRHVRVPMCVSYDVGPEGITAGRVYMLASVMMEQLGATVAEAAG